MKKIDAMHAYFGVVPDKRCEDCSNLIKGKYHTKFLRKCTLYGATNSEASDWRKKYVACGLFNKEWKGQEMIRFFQSENAKGRRIMRREMEPIDGQIEMEDL